MSKTKEEIEAKACRVDGCDCSGFVKNPMVSTDCVNCHHDFSKHARSGS